LTLGDPAAKTDQVRLNGAAVSCIARMVGEKPSISREPDAI
jgi:hypothetical protein